MKGSIGSWGGESSIVWSTNHHDDRVLFSMNKTRVTKYHDLLRFYDVFSSCDDRLYHTWDKYYIIIIIL